MIRAVVFDFGQVMASGEGIYSEPARLLGVSPASVEALYWQDRRAYDAGGSDAAYWGLILRTLGRPATPEMVAQLARLDAELWTVVRPQALQLLRDVRRAGRGVAVVSNAPFALDLALSEQPYVDDADAWFVSASMGVTKPDKAVYYRVTEVLELEPPEIAFLDDRPANVAGGESFGWLSHLWVSDEDARAWLQEIDVLPRVWVP